MFPIGSPTMLDTFKEDPSTFVIAIVAAVVGLVLAIVALASLRKRNLALALSGGALAVSLLSVGTAARTRAARLGMTEDLLAQPGLDQAERTRIRADREANANNAFGFAAAAAALPLLLGLGAGVAALARKRA